MREILIEADLRLLRLVRYRTNAIAGSLKHANINVEAPYKFLIKAEILLNIHLFISYRTVPIMLG